MDKKPFDATTIETELGSTFKGPGPVQAACSAADITQLQTNMKNVNLSSYDDLALNLSATCKACMIRKTGDATWGPIVVLSSDPTKGFVNYGACHASVNGNSDCGKAYQYTQFCVNSACAMCTTTNDQAACTNAATGANGVCKAQNDTINVKCPSFGSSQTKCGTTLDQHVKALCGPV